MTAIIVFAKTPEPGQVKTRLCPPLSPADAARLHAWLARRTLETAVGSGLGPVIMYGGPCLDHPFFRRCVEDFPITLRPQCEGDLGRRMAAAFAESLAHGGRALLIGCDCPALDGENLFAAAEVLEEGADAVLTPAEDGGYVLIGLSQPRPSLFEDIPWGGPQVLEATRARLRAQGLDWQELPTLWDVDRPADLVRLIREYIRRPMNHEGT